MKLRKYQSDFLASFFDSASKPNHLLIAPPGSGKTLMVVRIIDKLFSTKANQILILTSARVMADQYKMIIHEYKPDAVPMILSTRTYREYEAVKRINNEILPNIIISTWDSALDENAQQFIMSTDWELIIIDSLMRSTTSQKAILLEKLNRKVNSKHILIISDPMSGETIKEIIGEEVKSFKITSWSLKELYSEFRQLSPVVIRILDYKRTDREIEFIHSYLDISKQLPGKAFGNLLRQRLVCSSLFAAEESLRRFRNRLFHTLEDDIDNDEDENFQDIYDNRHSWHVDKDQIDRGNDPDKREEQTILLSKALSSLERIQVDSKFDALQSYLEENTKSNSRIWIYSTYQTTIKYLHTSLNENFSDVYYINGGMSPSSVNETISRFNREGGILISSNTKLEGYFINFNRILFYDIPTNPSQLYAILSRMMTSEYHKFERPLELLMLKDVSKTLDCEEENIQSIKHSLLSNLSNQDLT